MMTIYVNKGDDLLSVDESVITQLLKMGAVDFADRNENSEKSDSVKYNLKISITKRRKNKE